MAKQIPVDSQRLAVRFRPRGIGVQEARRIADGFESWEALATATEAEVRRRVNVKGRVAQAAVEVAKLVLKEEDQYEAIRERAASEEFARQDERAEQEEQEALSSEDEYRRALEIVEEWEGDDDPENETVS